MFWARAWRSFARAMWFGDVDVPWWVRTVWALGALYVLLPFDAIRDVRLPGGLVDDLLVAGLAWMATAEAFDRFRAARGWKPPGAPVESR